MSLRRNTVWNLAGAGLPLVVGAATIPYLIKQVGVEAFGVLTLIWALIGYFSLFDFGLGRALTQQVAAALAAGERARLPSLVKTGLRFTVVTGLGGGILLAALAYLLATKWLNVSVNLQHSAFQALLVAAIGIPLTTVTTGLRGVLEAYEEFRVVNLLRMILGIANFGLPALSVMTIGDSLVWMVASLIFARAVMLIAHAWQVTRLLPKGWMRAEFRQDDMRQLLSFGVWMTISNIISPLMVTADRFVISSLLGASVVAYYTVPFEALIRVLVIPGALTSALFPRLTAVLMTDKVAARRLYRRCVTVLFAILLPVCLVISVGAKWGLTLWLGNDFSEHAWLVVSIMAFGLLFNGMAHLPFSAVQASGNARETARLHIVELMFYVPLLIGLLKIYGIVGAAIAWTARVSLDMVALEWMAGRSINQGAV